MRGVAVSLQYARRLQHRRCGADGRKQAAGLMLGPHAGEDCLAGLYEFYPRSAGQEHAVERLFADRGQWGIPVQGDAISSGDMFVIPEGGDGDFGAGAAQQVDGRDGFNFFKTVRQDCENRRHGLHSKPMSDDSHRFFAGKHLVVLGAGYVGGEVARQAVARGMQVTALTRNPGKVAALRSMGVQAIEADLATDEWHAHMPAQADFVLNCVSSGGGGVEGYRRSYLAGMQSIIAWAGQVRAGTLVYTGSTSVYPQDNGVTVDENASTDPQNERAALLLQTENLIREHAGFRRWFILRLAGIYGPGRHHVLDQIRAGETLPGSATHRLNLAHRDDICAAIWAALAAPADVANEIYNVADDAPPTKAELANWLADSLKLPPPKFDASAVSVRRRVVPDRIILNGKLKRQLGWRPVYPDYRAGYADILAAL